MLDLSTILVSSCLVTLLAAAIYALSWLRERADYCLLWMGVASILGVVGAMMRILLPLSTAAVLGNDAVLLGLGCVWMACRTFGGKRTSPLLLLVAPLLWTLLSIVPHFSADLDLRIGTIALLSGILTVGPIYEFWGKWTDRISPLGWIVGIMGLKGVSDFLRAFLALVRYRPDEPLTAPAVMTSLTIGGLSSIAYIVLIAFGMVHLLRERSEAGYRGAALVDPVTGLLNRRRFEPALAVEFERAIGAGRTIALLIVDADMFKAFNDLYGRLAGERCLGILGEVIREALYRPVDLAFRYGGEEFALLLPETDAEAAGIIAERLHHGLRRRAIAHRAAATGLMTVSIGLAAMRPGADDAPYDLMRRADEALHAAKAAGRNRTCARTTAIDRAALRRA